MLNVLCTCLVFYVVAIKKRGREYTSPLVTSRKQHRASTTVDTVRKEAAKKSKLNKNQRQRITKDEEEVAETLYTLAGMFSDADHQKIDDEEDIRPTPQEDTRKISSKVTLGAVCPSNVVKSTAEVISRTLEARQPKLFFSSKQAAKPIIDMNQSGGEEIHLDQVAASGFEYGKNKYSYKDLVQSPNLPATRATRCETYKSCCLFEGTTFSSGPRVVGNKISTEMSCC
ncbi:uncharacterized protein LOC121807252 [Salvia splendens]|uniref:uncharacterized protein LOC121807252 n=1 Tax=Salvia splendens TaxID=180675 RepID=UPI001C253F37|nr:uncharacterized protein LOC121807252 [Salvia splendens]